MSNDEMMHQFIAQREKAKKSVLKRRQRDSTPLSSPPVTEEGAANQPGDLVDRFIEGAAKGPGLISPDPSPTSALPTWTAPADLDQAATAITQLGRNMHQHAYLVGRYLLWAKKKVGHGHFLDWLEKNVWFGHDTASRMMDFATRCMKASKILEYHTRKFRTERHLPTGKPDPQEEHSAQPSDDFDQDSDVPPFELAGDDPPPFEADELAGPEQSDSIDSPTRANLSLQRCFTVTLSG